MEGRSFNAGRVVGWSAYEEFLKEYHVDSNLISEPIYLRAITYGVSLRISLPLEDWTPHPRIDHGEVLDTPLYSKTIACPGAYWGCVPIVGLDYATYTNPDLVEYRHDLEKALSTIFYCEATDSQGVPVDAQHRKGGYLTFYANPEILNIISENIQLIVRGLDVEALAVVNTNPEMICWGPEGLLFGGNGLTGGKTPEVMMNRSILKEDLAQDLMSSPVIDFQAQDPILSYNDEATGIGKLDALKEIQINNVDIPRGQTHLAEIVTIPKQRMPASLLTAPPAIYGANISVLDVGTPVKVAPLDVAAPYHFRVMSYNHAYNSSYYLAYQNLYPANVVLLREDAVREGESVPAYTFWQIQEIRGTDGSTSSKMIPVSDEQLVGLWNTVQIRNSTVPMFVSNISTAESPEHTWDYSLVMNAELTGAMSTKFADLYTFDPYPNGYEAEPQSEDYQTLQELFTWGVNFNTWTAMEAENRANYRWVMVQMDRMTPGNHSDWYLYPVEKATGRFDFVAKFIGAGCGPAFSVIRTHRYGLAEDLGSGMFQLHSDFSFDQRYYSADEDNVVSWDDTFFYTKVIGFVVFNSPDDYFICNENKNGGEIDHQLVYDPSSRSWVNGDPLTAAQKATASVAENRELLYESVQWSQRGPNDYYLDPSHTFYFQAMPVAHGNSYINIREWTSAEATIFRKAFLGLEDDNCTGLYGGVQGHITPYRFTGSWWAISDSTEAAEEVANESTLYQYLDAKYDKSMVLVDPIRHCPVLNPALCSYLNLGRLSWERAYSLLTTEELFKVGCGFTDEEWSIWKSQILIGLSTSLVDSTLEQLSCRSIFYKLPESAVGGNSYKVNFYFGEKSDIATRISNNHTLDGMDASEYLSLVGPFTEENPMSTVLAPIPADFQKAGGPQAAVGTSGTHQTWSLAVTSSNGSLLPMSGSDGIIPDPADTSTITMWDDMLHWNHLLEALSENKKIDILGAALRQLKEKTIVGAGDNYIEFQNGNSTLRLYLASEEPSDTDIPDGSIGLGW